MKYQNEFNVMSLEDAKPLIKHIQLGIWTCFSEAWEEWQRLLELPEMQGMDSRVRASYMHARSCEKVKQFFNGRKGLSFSYHEQNFFLTVDNKLHIRFKKLDKNLRHRNIQTGFQWDISRQLPLPGFQKATIVVAGYQLNQIRTEIRGIYITCSKDDRLVWSYEIIKPETKAILGQTEFDTHESQRVKIKIKSEDEKKA